MTSRQGLLRDNAAVVVQGARVIDVIVLGAAGALSFMIRFPASGLEMPARYGLLLLYGCVLSVALFPLFGLYDSWRGASLIRLAGRSLFAWAAVFSLILMTLVALKQSQEFSRLWLGYWALTGTVGLMAARVAVHGMLRVMRGRGWNRRRVVLVGAGRMARELAARVAGAGWTGYEILCCFDDDSMADAWSATGIPLHTELADLPIRVDAESVDEVWIALPLSMVQRMQQVMALLGNSPVTIRFVPDLFGFRLLNHGVGEVAGLPVIDVTSSPMTGLNRLAKAMEDRVLAAVFLVLLSPLMAVIAVAVKLGSRGPVFYRQTRMGWNGRPFVMLKFRSMPVDAEGRTGAVWATRGEQRATAVGAFLRRTSLDELPQFINVLRGEMSIVGPRPERPQFVDRFKEEIPGYMQKHLVKAGITGWAQVNGWRGDTDLRRRIEHDLYYIEHWSVWFDLKIILMTAFRGLVHENAY